MTLLGISRRRSTGRAAVFSALVLAAALTGACSSGGSSGSTPATATTPTTQATVTTTVAPSSSATSTPTGTATTPAPGTGTTGTGTAGTPHCSGTQLRFTALGSNGAAGTIADAVQVTNAGPAACWTYGYVGLTIIDGAGHRLPTTTVRGAPMATVPGTAERVTLPAGEWAWFALAYHDSAPPSCQNPPASGTRLAVIAPDTTQSQEVTLRTDAACGRIGVSPVLRASSWQPRNWGAP